MHYPYKEPIVISKVKKISPNKISVIGLYIILIAIVLFGFFSTKRYGMPWDEETETKILRQNIYEYVSLFVTDDSPILDHYHSMDVGTVRIWDDWNKDHGMSPYYIIGGLLELDALSNHGRMLLIHYVTYLYFIGGAIALLFLLKNLFDNKTKLVAPLTTLIYVLTPRLFAESHYNNKDVVLLSLFFIILYFGWKVVETDKIRYAIPFAIATAFATNVKIIGPYPFLLVGLLYIITKISDKALNKKAFLLMIGTTIGAFLTYVLITPAIWHHPFEFVYYILYNAVQFTSWDSPMLYNGQILKYSVTGVPKTYLLSMICLTVPAFILILLVLSVILIATGLFRKKEALEKKNQLFILFSVAGWLIPIFFSLVKSIIVYNAWRHYYFIYSFIMITLAYGIYRLISWNKFMKIFLALGICSLLAITIQGYPYQNTFYNVFAGKDVEHTYELDYWNLSLFDALNYVAEDSNGNTTVSAYESATYLCMSRTIPVLKHSENLHPVLPTECDQAEYILTNSTYCQIWPYELDPTKVLPKYELIKTIKAYGNNLVYIYKRK